MKNIESPYIWIDVQTALEKMKPRAVFVMLMTNEGKFTAMQKGFDVTNEKRFQKELALGIKVIRAQAKKAVDNQQKEE